jgi:hypothetical protein
MKKSYVDYLHLFVLVAFAVAQPIYDLIGKYPEFFVAHSAGPWLIISMILFLSFGLALFLVLFEIVLHAFSKRVQQGIHLFFVFSLTALIILPLIKKETLSDVLIIGISVISALLFTVLYARLQIARMFITMLLPVTLIFPLWFVFGSPVSRIVFQGEQIQAEKQIEIQNPMPIVFVLFDEFSTTALLDSKEQIDPVRFPNFAALASESLWFPNAITVSESTVIVIPSIVSGLNPKPDMKLMPTVTDHPNNLFTMLGGQYEFNVFEVMTTLCPDSFCNNRDNRLVRNYSDFFFDLIVIYAHIISPPGKEKNLPTLDARWAGFRMDVSHAPDTKKINLRHNADQLEQFISQIKSSSKPQLSFIHSMLPHIPYLRLPSGQLYSNEHRLPDGINSDKEGWLGEKPLIATAYNRYLQQVGYVDKYLGLLREKLISEGIYDDILLIIMADHGVAFEPWQSRRDITDVNKNEILKIPLFIKLPQQRTGRIDKRIVTSVDVLPTIIEVIQADVPWKLDGFSLISGQEEIRNGFDFVGIKYRRYLSEKDIVGFSRLKWQIENFDEKTPFDRLVPKGPFQELNGSNIADLQIIEAEDMLLTSQNIGYFQHIEIENNFLPSLLSGYIEGAKGRDLKLAVAINGRIRLTTTTSNWNEKENFFSVLLPRSALQQGENIVNVYVIEQKVKEFLLRPLVIEKSMDVELHQTSNGLDILMFADGEKVTVEKSRENLNGYVDLFVITDSMLEITGWAADLVKERPASKIFMFKGEKLIWEGECGYTRKDVAETFNKPSISESGYYIGIPLKAFETTPGDIRLIALSDKERAFQLHIADKYKELFRQTIKE